jgi:starch-binding outer membrane protein, SusD/RagB family
MIKINIRLIVFVAGLFFLLQGCSDILEVGPDNSLKRSNVYGVPLDQYTIKTGLYNTLQELVEEKFILGELRGDLVVAGPGALYKKDYLEFFDHNISPENKFLDWGGFYKLINQCNDALVSLPKVKPDKDHENMAGGDTLKLNLKTYNHIVGEVLWLRAWAYFILVSNWGDVPFFTEPIYSTDQVKYLPPTKEDIILDQLETDLYWSVKHVFVNWAWGVGTRVDKMWNHETVNKCAAVNLLADVLMYRGKYEQAWSQDVLLKIIMPQPVIHGDPEYQENWNSSFNLTHNAFNGGPEWFNVLFRYNNENYRFAWFEQGLVLAFDTENIAGGGIYNEKHEMIHLTSNLASEGGSYIVKPSRSAVLGWKNQSDRYRGEGYSYFLDSTFIPKKVISGSQTITTNSVIVDTVIWKYVGVSPTGERREAYRTYGNVHIKRTVDLYLKAAEVANRLGIPGWAIQILSESRGRVGLPPANVSAGSTIEEIEDAIMEERARELAFEGERWYDLVRISKMRNDPNYLINMVLANVPEDKKDIVRARLEYQWADNKWKLPYSSNALKGNPLLNKD